MPTTLVVVDMQPVFEASRKPDVIAGVAQQILTAVQNNWAIVFLEYRGSGRTHQGLLKLAQGYNRKLKVSKLRDDGSSEVIRALRRRNFLAENFVVCGVNTDACVFDTAYGLAHKLGANVRIVRNACGSVRIVDWRVMRRYMRDQTRIQVI